MNFQNQNSVNELVDHLFRHYSGQMVSVLVRLFGFEKIDLIEDAIQDSLVCALKQWAYKGVPDNPRAWLIEVSKNRIIDRLRRQKNFEIPAEDLEEAFSFLQIFEPADSIRFANEVGENLLRMMFTCCHPAISPDSQVALTLKTVSGFSRSEIAHTFLSQEEAIAKMLRRAKQKLQKLKVKLEMPEPAKLSKRLDSVLKVLYLIFNEGYSVSKGENLIRTDLCHEAIRLGCLLANHPLTNLPKTHALLALFFFQAARLTTRLDENGDILLLSEQNRLLWDRKMINQGLHHFRKSAAGEELSDYHLEAEIASFHTLAKDYESTEWANILNCYESLLKRRNSPVVALNKVIALVKVEDEEKGLEELNKFQKNHKLRNYFPFYLTLGELQFGTGRNTAALDSYRKAFDLTSNESVRRFLSRKIREVENNLI